MSPAPDDIIVTSWTNGRKARVHLMRRPDGTLYILKKYAGRFIFTMIKEWLVTQYLQSRLSVTPRILWASPRRLTLALSYVKGERVLEWVLQRFGPENLDLAEFASFHGMQTNPTVQTAFAKFCSSRRPDADAFRIALKSSYQALHKIGWVHGSADPRNIIYDGSVAYIIDLDHARPAFNPAQTDGKSLKRWFQLDMPRGSDGQ